jgi:glycosyltransferase involved in cell wall biosynthesis
MLSVKRGLKNVVTAVCDIDDIEIVIAGYGPDEHILLPFFRKSKNVKYIGMISHSESLKWTSICDLTFALTDPTLPESRYASPNRLFEAMMLSKPVIVSENTAMAKIFENERCGLIVPYEDTDKLRDAILTLKNDENLRKELGRNGRTAYETRYNWRIMEDRLLSSYKTLLE